MANLMLRSPLTKMQREVDHLFDDFLQMNDGNGQSIWTPAVDVWETDDTYFFAFDLPGLTKEAVNITYQDGMLQISGERTWVQDENLQYHRVECPKGRFFRSVRLDPGVKAEGIQARFDNGVLTVHVSKAEEVRPRRIEIS